MQWRRIEWTRSKIRDSRIRASSPFSSRGPNGRQWNHSPCQVNLPYFPDLAAARQQHPQRQRASRDRYSGRDLLNITSAYTYSYTASQFPLHVRPSVNFFPFFGFIFFRVSVAHAHVWVWESPAAHFQLASWQAYRLLCCAGFAGAGKCWGIRQMKWYRCRT